MTVVANGDMPVCRFFPTIAIAPHYMAIGAGIRIAAEIGCAFAIREGKHGQADKASNGRTAQEN